MQNGRKMFGMTENDRPTGRLIDGDNEFQSRPSALTS